MTDDRPAPHRQPDEADQPRDHRPADETAAAAFDDGPADRTAADAHSDTSAFDQTAFAAPADDDHEAREREARDAEARIAEARERDAREREAREAEAREVEAREAEARQRDVEDRERREREAREADARERDERDRRARDEETARQSQPIYVQAPTPPEKRGNRGFGVLLAVVAAILFALLFSLGAALLGSVRDPNAFGDSFGRYIASPVFYVPAIAFLVLFVLLALVVNRGGWWAFVLGGLPVAILVYVVYVATRLLQNDVLDLAPSEQALILQRIVTFPDGILAGLLARELITWFGVGISARGRRVKAKNVEARAEYDRKLKEQPDHR